MFISKKAQRPIRLENTNREVLREIIGVRMGAVQSHGLAEVVISPGRTSTPHFHRKGEVTLSAGDAIMIRPQEVHQIRNQSDDDLVFMAVCVPAWIPDDTFETDLTEVG